MKSKSQTGIALITAMLIVALSTIIATQIFYQQQINLRRTFNQIQSAHMFQLFISAEQWAKIILQDDLEKENKTDSLLDDWAQTMPPIEAEGGQFQASLRDVQGCFNLNNLVINDQIQAEQVAIFKALLQQKSLNEQLLWSLIDWLDSNDEPTAMGAEWETYSQYTPPYRTANQALTEIPELLAVAYWNAEIIRTLNTDICVLPAPPAVNEFGRYTSKQSQVTPLNINTISLTLLKSLSDKMLTANLEKIIMLQQDEGFASVPDFFDKLDADNSQTPKLSSTLKADLLSIDSHYFMLHYTGWIGNLEQHYHSLLYRNTKIESLYRSRSY